MKSHLIFLCIIFLLIFPIIISTCPSSKCSTSGPAVRFPFQLLPQQHPINCSYPSFDLTCTAQAFTALTLPNSGNFYVRDIDYYHQQIILYDPQDCIPNRLLNLNLSNSPFDINYYYYYRNYTFLSCPTDLVQSRYTTIDCLSNPTTSVLATVSPSLTKSMSNACTIISSVPIPISWPYMYDQNGFTSDLGQDFRLSWNITGCISSEICELGCFKNCQTGLSPNDLRVFKIVVLCFTIPAVSFTVCIALYFRFLDQRRRQLEWAQADGAMISVHPGISTPNNGLDESTIESYGKMVVGESKRIPGWNDIVCPICLSDYCAKDTLRCIPECQHCFHADCVDEWLRCNALLALFVVTLLLMLEIAFCAESSSYPCRQC